MRHTCGARRRRPRSGLRRISQTQWIVISMVVGIADRLALPRRPTATRGFAATDLQVLSTIFLRMIKSLIVPLLFATLVVGIAGHGDDMKQVGRLAFRSIIYFEIVTTLALVVGLLAVNIVKPGVGVNLAAAHGGDGRRAREDADDVRRRARAHRAAELLRGGGEERGAADRLLRHHLRRRAVAGAGAGEDVHARRSARA